MGFSKGRLTQFTEWCEACKGERQLFKARLPLKLTLKPTKPFEGWSIDLMTEITPVSPLGYRHLLLAVNCFPKYTELLPLRTRDSFKITEWMLDDLVPHYGVPRFVHVDSGTELEGNFRLACQDLRISLRVTNAGVPQENRLG